MTIGDKIKKIRIARGLTQKQLAIMSDMSEPAIRNYELGNRQPSEKHIQKIAYALGVSEFSLSNPKLESLIGVMHTLFELEETYGADLYSTDGKVYIAIDNGRTMLDYMTKWNNKKNMYENGEINKEEYENWKRKFLGK